MKNKILYCGILLALLFCVGSCRCRDKSEDLSCKLLVYASSSRTYQIRFNGNDSIETKCGSMKINNYELLSGVAGRRCLLDSVYVVKKSKLQYNQADKIRNLMKAINSKEVTDTLEKGWKDVWFYGSRI